MQRELSKTEGRYAEVFAALTKGTPIRPGAAGWTIEEVLALAGACKTAARLYLICGDDASLPLGSGSKGRTKNLNAAIDDHEREGGMLTCLRDDISEPLARALCGARRNPVGATKQWAVVGDSSSPARASRVSRERTSR